MDPLPLWEILVPVASNDGERYPLAHHHVWDDYVRARAGGETIFKKAKGSWIDEGALYADEVIPVRFRSTCEVMRDISAFTLRHYGQKAVFVNKVSDESYIFTLDDLLAPEQL